MEAPHRLDALKLQLQLRRALAENAALKQAVHAEVDVMQASKRASKLQAKLKLLSQADAQLGSALCYGLPPGWSSRAAGATFSWPRMWRQGTEVLHTASAAGGQSTVTHHTRTVQLCVADKPFAIGGLRAAFYAKDAASGRFVLKRALLESSNIEKSVRGLHADAEAAALSEAAAKAFSALTRRVPPASVVVLAGSRGEKAAFLKEPWLDTSGKKWVKWTRNDGHVYAEGKADAAVQAFMHFSLHYLRQHLGTVAMVLDAQASGQAYAGGSAALSVACLCCGACCAKPIVTRAAHPCTVQGIQQPLGSSWLYMLTDPAMCSGDRRYGASDLGAAAIQSFLSSHSCSACAPSVAVRTLEGT
eukprot:scaffold11.g3878.t1